MYRTIKTEHKAYTTHNTLTCVVSSARDNRSVLSLCGSIQQIDSRRNKAAGTAVCFPQRSLAAPSSINVNICTIDAAGCYFFSEVSDHLFSKQALVLLWPLYSNTLFIFFCISRTSLHNSGGYRHEPIADEFRGGLAHLYISKKGMWLSL